MANVARSVSTIPGGSTIRLRRIKIFFQVFPGNSGTDSERGISGVDYVLKIGSATTAGKTAADGSVEFEFPAGTKAKLTIMGTKYDFTTRRSFEGSEDLLGQKRRLAALGYEPGSINLRKDKDTILAMLNFQADNNLNANSDSNTVADPATQSELQSVFGE